MMIGIGRQAFETGKRDVFWRHDGILMRISAILPIESLCGRHWIRSRCVVQARGRL
jgi:hypothetical protein